VSKSAGVVQEGGKSCLVFETSVLLGIPRKTPSRGRCRYGRLPKLVEAAGIEPASASPPQPALHA